MEDNLSHRSSKAHGVGRQGLAQEKTRLAQSAGEASTNYAPEDITGRSFGSVGTKLKLSRCRKA